MPYDQDFCLWHLGLGTPSEGDHVTLASKDKCYCFSQETLRLRDTSHLPRVTQQKRGLLSEVVFTVLCVASRR